MVSRIPPPEDDGTNRRPRLAGLLALLLVSALAVGIWLISGRDPGSGTSTATDDTPASAPDPASTPRRIIEGADGELYWTDDHHESFSRALL